MNYFAAMQTFVRAAELRSFNRTAIDLSMKKSTVTRHIAWLEEDLQIALFNRTPRGLNLTEAGQLFFHQSLSLLENLAVAKGETAALNLRPAGLLKIVLPAALSQQHILPRLATFLQRNPAIDINLQCYSQSDTIIGAAVDLELRIGVLTESSYHARKLAPQRYFAYANPACLTRPDFPQHCQQLREQALFCRSEAGGWWQRESDELLEIALPQTRFSSREETVLLDWILHNAAIAILPDWLAFNALKEGRIVQIFPQVSFQQGREASAIWFIYPHKKIVSSKVRAFIDFIIEEIGDPPYWLQ